MSAILSQSQWNENYKYVLKWRTFSRDLTWSFGVDSTALVTRCISDKANNSAIIHAITNNKAQIVSVIMRTCLLVNNVWCCYQYAARLGTHWYTTRENQWIHFIMSLEGITVATNYARLCVTETTWPSRKQIKIVNSLTLLMWTKCWCMKNTGDSCD